jgi:hypothetical protein
MWTWSFINGHFFDNIIDFFLSKWVVKMR